jgi:2-oxoglutarate ferredoxin oxidoreductase subunit delta
MGKMDEKEPLCIRNEWCKGCGLCVAFCPRGVLALNMSKVDVQYPENCIRCGLCQQICPDYAIYVRGNSDE